MAVGYGKMGFTGFTLIELSVVIVIISLIVAGLECGIRKWLQYLIFVFYSSNCFFRRSSAFSASLA